MYIDLYLRIASRRRHLFAPQGGSLSALWLQTQVVFHPSDIGVEQAGVAEAVVQAVQAVHPALRPLLFTNVILTGERDRASLP